MTQGQKSDWDDADHRNEVLLGLRQRRVLVQSAVQQKKVCVFGGFQAADEYMKSLGWQGEIFEAVLIRKCWLTRDLQYTSEGDSRRPL